MQNADLIRGRRFASSLAMHGHRGVDDVVNYFNVE